MGMFGSQAGNISFPTWELVLPVMGMIFVVEEAEILVIIMPLY